MTQKKTIQIVGDDIFPQALIIGDNTLVQMLLEGLKIRGCDVKLAKSPQEVLTPDSPLRYDYIFQLGTSDNAIEIKRKLLSREGKFLLVELDSEFTDLGNKGRELKIFRAGKLSLWDGHDLTGRLYKAIFSRSSYGIEDERKVAVIKKDISPDLPKSGNVSLPKPFFPKQIVQKSVTRPERTLPRKKISRRGLGLIILFLVIISGISASAGWYFLSLKKSLSYLKIH